jgi:hypothetical protein
MTQAELPVATGLNELEIGHNLRVLRGTNREEAEQSRRGQSHGELRD